MTNTAHVPHLSVNCQTTYHTFILRVEDPVGVPKRLLAVDKELGSPPAPAAPMHMSGCAAGCAAAAMEVLGAWFLWEGRSTGSVVGSHGPLHCQLCWPAREHEPHCRFTTQREVFPLDGKAR